MIQSHKYEQIQSVSRIITVLITTILLQAIYCLEISASHHPQYFKIWIDYSSERLAEMGQDFINKDMCDSALVCYSIVAGRYNKSLSVDEQKLCRNAYFNRWQIYFNKLYDYSKAYENLTKAEEISENIDDIDPEVELGFAYFHETLEDNIQDGVNRVKNIQYSRKAFYAALKQQNSDLLDRAFVNYITAAYKNGELTEESRKIFRDYTECKNISYPFFKEFNTDLYIIYDYILRSKYNEALASAQKLNEKVIAGNNPDQFLYIAQCVQFDIYKKKGAYVKALQCMDVVKEILQRNPYINKRTTLEMYKDMYTCNKMLGDNDAYKDNINKYLLLKDTLLSMKQITRMSEISFLGEISRMDESLAEMRQKSRTQNMFFILMAIIVFIVVTSAVMLYMKNKRLTITNKKLYDNFNELIKAKNKEKELKLRNAMNEVSEEKSDISNTTAKYKDSNLKSNEKDDILARILKVMDDKEKICDTEFSAERLAELTYTSYKNVSQVINEKFECNFNVLLNRYRIEEACRRLADMEGYGMYTIEAVSESVGFKSRTRFASNFKKVVGISPSEYRKISIERNAEKH